MPVISKREQVILDAFKNPARFKIAIHDAGAILNGNLISKGGPNSCEIVMTDEIIVFEEGTKVMHCTLVNALRFLQKVAENDAAAAPNVGVNVGVAPELPEN